MAEGFLHDFQGWVVFMASFGLMVLLMILLSQVARTRTMARAVGLEFPNRCRRAFRASRVPHGDGHRIVRGVDGRGRRGPGAAESAEVIPHRGVPGFFDGDRVWFGARESLERSISRR